MVDTLCLLIAVAVPSASVQERDVAATVVEETMVKMFGPQKPYTDAADAGQSAQSIERAHPGLSF